MIRGKNIKFAMSKLGKEISDSEIEATMEKYGKHHDGYLDRNDFEEMFMADLTPTPQNKRHHL